MELWCFSLAVDLLQYRVTWEELVSMKDYVAQFSPWAYLWGIILIKLIKVGRTILTGEVGTIFWKAS